MSREFLVDQTFGTVRWPVGVDGHWTRGPYTCSSKGAAQLILALLPSASHTVSGGLPTTPAYCRGPDETARRCSISGPQRCEPPGWVGGEVLGLAGRRFWFGATKRGLPR